MIPYLTLKKRGKNLFLLPKVAHVNKIAPSYNGESLITCIAATSGIGRLIFGKVSDFKRVNRIFLQQVMICRNAIIERLLGKILIFSPV